MMFEFLVSEPPGELGNLFEVRVEERALRLGHRGRVTREQQRVDPGLHGAGIRPDFFFS
jgi:hypothetical protein